LLYNHVKSAIHFSAGLKGHFRDDVLFNIETLVNTLYELERNEEHPLYPFIAAWNSRFVALAGPDFGAVRRFRQLILGALKKWMCPENSARSNYYKGLIPLQLEISNNPPPQIVLYKLHGSLNQKRDSETKNLFSVDQIESVDDDKMEVIFGRDFKLEAADPYLFFAYAFRHFTLLTRLIVTIGYGFGTRI
jgi:hypothetical protein